MLIADAQQTEQERCMLVQSGCGRKLCLLYALADAQTGLLLLCCRDVPYRCATECRMCLLQCVAVCEVRDASTNVCITLSERHVQYC